MTQSLDKKSWYSATAASSGARNTLNGDVTADVCIIGAGYTGLSAALELARAGYTVEVLEARTIGDGASGRNGGQICTGFSSGQDRIVAQLGASDARKCFEIAEDAKALIRTRAAESPIQCDLQWGYLHVASKPSAMNELKATQEEWAELGYAGNTLLSRDELAPRLASNRYHGALREEGAGHLHPLNYCMALAHMAEVAGAVIHTRSTVLSVDLDTTTARTAQGSVKARFMIIAGNAYLGRTVPTLYGRVMPVTSYVAATSVLDPAQAASLIPHNEAVGDTNFIIDYFRRSSDNRLLFGGEASYSTMEPRNLAATMKAKMVRVFPQLSEAQMDYVWGGFIAITSNRIPDCGRLKPNIYYAHGYSGQGVALAGMYGALMADCVRGQAERFDLLGRIRHLPFPGGALRTPLLAAAMLYYRLRDALA